MANPVHIVYPESKTCPKELAQAQSNVYKIMLECWKQDPFKRPTFEFLAHMFEDFSVTSQPQYMEWIIQILPTFWELSGAWAFPGVFESKICTNFYVLSLIVIWTNIRNFLKEAFTRAFLQVRILYRIFQNFWNVKVERFMYCPSMVDYWYWSAILVWFTLYSQPNSFRSSENIHRQICNIHT